jgi:hypothetical protein
MIIKAYNDGKWKCIYMRWDILDSGKVEFQNSDKRYIIYAIQKNE